MPDSRVLRKSRLSQGLSAMTASLPCSLPRPEPNVRPGKGGVNETGRRRLRGGEARLPGEDGRSLVDKSLRGLYDCDRIRNSLSVERPGFMKRFARRAAPPLAIA